MRIIKLQSSNIKRLKAIEIVPKDNVVIISGKNEQGKSSALDSIELALKATNFKKPGRQMPRPIRDGQDKAQVVLELDEYTVTRNWTANDKTYLKVENREGASFKSPQALIDSFLGDLSFDPLEFARLRPADQKETLVRLVDTDIDLRELEEQKKQLYEDRTLKGRELKNAQAHIDETLSADTDGLPDKEISVSGLSAQLMDAAQKNNLRNAQLATIFNWEQDIEETLSDIAGYERDLKTAQAELVHYRKQLTQSQSDIKSMPHIDPVPIQKKIGDAEHTNAQIRFRDQHQHSIKQAADFQFQYDTLSKKIEKLDLAKSNALSTAKMPILGLGVDDDGITFNGKPFSQIGSANQLKVSLAIAMAMNPTLKVIRISDGSLLDADNKKIIEQMAKEHDYQCWIEEVESGAKVGFTLEDGELVAIDGSKIIKEKVIEE